MFKIVFQVVEVSAKRSLSQRVELLKASNHPVPGESLECFDVGGDEVLRNDQVIRDEDNIASLRRTNGSVSSRRDPNVIRLVKDLQCAGQLAAGEKR